MQMTPNTQMPAIEAHGLGKEYRLGEQVSLKRTLQRLTRTGVPANRFGALNDMNLRIGPGECLGVVGSNGSGKSTFLHLIAGITAPTEGELRVAGTVLPLLQIGAGFHPDLTGRENVMLFGTILGLPRTEIEEKMDAIFAFAEIEEHIDTPNKRFSDGMQARLSCALAVLFSADIFLFDEVLAVADGEFREKCLFEIRRLVDSGRTVLFVSHDLEQVRVVGQRVLWI